MLYRNWLLTPDCRTLSTAHTIVFGAAGQVKRTMAVLKNSKTLNFLHLLGGRFSWCWNFHVLLELNDRRTTLHKRCAKATFGNPLSGLYFLLKEGRIKMKILLSLEKYPDVGLYKCTQNAIE